MIRIGRTVLSLEEPVNDALAAIEQVADEPLAAAGPFEEPPPPLPPPAPLSSSPALGTPPTDAGAAAAAPGESAATTAAARALRKRARWSMTDRIVLAAAATVLALSLAGLVWLLKG